MSTSCSGELIRKVLLHMYVCTLNSHSLFMMFWNKATSYDSRAPHAGANARQLQIDLFHIVCAHAYIGHVARYFSIIGETLQRWGKRILSH